jgi:hypothetical protein
LPVHVTFKRFYTGRAKQWDELNILSCYKGVEDGIALVLGCNDKYFHPTVEQIRDDFTELEIIIEPAWSRVEVAS